MPRFKGLVELGWFEGLPPVATITETSKGYYVLNMDGREVGGTNCAALKRFAKKEGFRVAEIERYNQRSILSHGL